MNPIDATRIRFESDRTTLVSAGVEVVVPVGARAVAQRLFRHHPPMSGEVEQAIDMVEDALASTGLRHAERGDLQSADPQMLDVLGLQSGDVYRTRDQVEMQFECLASVAMGQPATGGMAALSSESAAMLVILRECMHHLGFQGIHCAAG